MAQGKYAEPKPRRRRSANAHKRFYLCLGAAAATVAVLTLCTCALLLRTAETGSPSSLPQESSAPPSSALSSSASVASEESASSEDFVSSDTQSEEAASADPVSSAAAAPAAFTANPIDAALNEAVAAASNHVQLLNAYETALDAWKSEISREAARLKRLLPDASAFSAEQTAWERQVEEEFAAPEKEGEGSNAPLERAHAAYDVYRARAEKLYAQLIRYDPSYRIG